MPMEVRGQWRESILNSPLSLLTYLLAMSFLLCCGSIFASALPMPLPLTFQILLFCFCVVLGLGPGPCMSHGQVLYHCTEQPSLVRPLTALVASLSNSRSAYECFPCSRLF